MEFTTIQSKCMKIQSLKDKAMSKATLTAFEGDIKRRVEKMDEAEKMLHEVFRKYTEVINDLYEENKEYERRLSELE